MVSRLTHSKQSAEESLLQPNDTFIHRHIGPDDAEVAAMLDAIEAASLDELIEQTIPQSIRMKQPLNIGPVRGEHELIEELRTMAEKNIINKSFIGMGYYGTIVPPVIQRNILENPGWYTQYTPYQAEIAQGRLEALMNFQTTVADLTGLPLANASMLDEATAAAEALTMCLRIGNKDGAWFVSDKCHPQTIAVVRTRAKSLGVELVVGDEIELVHQTTNTPAVHGGGFAGLLLQYPATDGAIIDYADLIKQAHEDNIKVVMATDLLALTLIKSPGEFGADIAVGSSQRFGIPMGFGGPHAAFMATHEEHARKMPGRIIGLSKDAQGNPAYRMAIQTREQHIKRDRATSNICTAQVLLAIMAGMYAVYHGPEGLKRIARRVHALTNILASALRDDGLNVTHDHYFDTLRITPQDNDNDLQSIIERAADTNINLRTFDDGSMGISLDETTTLDDVQCILKCFSAGRDDSLKAHGLQSMGLSFESALRRTTPFLTHPVFNSHHSETEMLRYITKLQSRDLSLAQSMIPLGSCTMKLNGTSEMLPVTWPEFGNMHPFAPLKQTKGYQELFSTLENWLCEITGFAACSLQPNAGSQGEYAGLLAIRGWHEAQEGTTMLRVVSDDDDTKRDSAHTERGATRNICLIPTSAHGTNPASAIVAGMQVVPVKCDENGNVDISDLRTKAEKHKDTLAAFMITYPSTHGVFEESIREMCDIVHDNGGLVYLDGANMNAQVGLCRPGDFGADVCHLNLHKTFCIPHGGGGPGMGPICCTEQLAPFLPTTNSPSASRDVSSRNLTNTGASDSTRVASLEDEYTISAAPYGSPSILPISWVYIALMGSAGLKRASQVAILNANYMCRRLRDHYDILYRGKNGRVGHEFIIDCRAFKKSAGIEIDDIAKRLMDYGFHAPTMSFPVPGTLMIEPTESESKAELDRFCDALISIRKEIEAIEQGSASREDNVLKGAPHTTKAIASDDWQRAYTREKAAFPADWLRDYKFWPAVGRIDNPFGDRNLICSCPGVEELAELSE